MIVSILEVKRTSCFSYRCGLGFALVCAAEDVELAALLDRLALIDVDAPQVDVDAARTPESAKLEIRRLTR